MKILFHSHQFSPSVGGVEQVGLILASEFTRMNHEVRIITQTPGGHDESFSYPVIRRPKPVELLRLVRWCEVIFHNNISLRAAWPMAFVHRPWIIAHHIWIARADGALAWQDRLKRFLLRFATNISVSQQVADHLPVASVVIGNPYRDDLFGLIPEIRRDRELVFLGRLVSDKGADLLIESLVLLKAEGLQPRLTMIGAGPELAELEQLVSRNRLQEQVSFVGTKQGRELVELLNQHQILVMPSRWLEPFGIVALEGIACGCVVVGSSGGGLKNAIGPGGVTFPNNNVAALTQILADLLHHPEKLAQYRETSAHLARHQRGIVAKAYLKVIESARQPGS
jgi:glycogen synthase